MTILRFFPNLDLVAFYAPPPRSDMVKDVKIKLGATVVYS